MFWSSISSLPPSLSLFCLMKSIVFVPPDGGCFVGVCWGETAEAFVKDVLSTYSFKL